MQLAEEIEDIGMNSSTIARNSLTEKMIPDNDNSFARNII